MLIGAVITSAIFYLVNKKNEDELRDSIKEMINKSNQSKVISDNLKEAMNDPKTMIIADRAITIVLAPRDELYFYPSNDCTQMNVADYTTIRSILEREKNRKNPDDLMIIIKKMAGASFKNAVDILDAINDEGIPAGHFAEIDLTDRENNCIHTFKKH